MSRPEHIAPPEMFYDDTEARKYSANSRIISIQKQMSERALELLNFPSGESFHLLDLGAGSGLSGEVLSAAGHTWVGLDVSSSMLDVAVEKEVEGDMILYDLGQGLPFKPGSFDGAISISALQWLCNRDKKSHNPVQRMRRFFQTLYNCLDSGGRAVFQFYPESPSQVELITNSAMRCGFTGGVVVDYPNSAKAKKLFLCLFAGVPVGDGNLPQGLSDNSTESVAYDSTRRRPRQRKGKKVREGVKSKQWVLKKKERMRKQGKKVKNDSRYTARKRSSKF